MTFEGQPPGRSKGWLECMVQHGNSSSGHYCSPRTLLSAAHQQARPLLAQASPQFPAAPFPSPKETASSEPPNPPYAHVGEAAACVKAGQVVQPHRPVVDVRHHQDAALGGVQRGAHGQDRGARVLGCSSGGERAGCQGCRGSRVHACMRVAARKQKRLRRCGCCVSMSISPGGTV
jgi:hypothetical protein